MLSGCGVFDGSEIHEATLTLLSIANSGASYDIYAPDISQYHVINHITGEAMNEKRNVLIEAARIARGNMGFEIRYRGRSVVNLGDTLFLPDAWKELPSPDVLMLPIGGRTIGNTMDEDEALEAVRIIQPGLVIPMHYNCPMLFSKHGNPADDKKFKRQVEYLGMECCILNKGESVHL